ncbi:MAG: arylesterase [Motiliproteus sp.]
MMTLNPLWRWLQMTALLLFCSLSTVVAAASQTADTIPPPQANSKDSQPVLLVLGDSISAGYGLKPQQGWVTLLQQRLQQRWQQGDTDNDLPIYRVINASISGDTTSGGLRRLPLLLQQYRPELVLIELGANDGLRGTPLPLIEKNLQQLVVMGQQAGAQVMVLGMRIPPNYGPRYGEGFYKLFDRVASRSKSAYLPFLMAGVGGVPELMQTDGLHPNQAAQPLMLENVWPVLQPLLGE